MAESVVAAAPPNDGREWEAQCARCGSSVVRETCGSCGGDVFLLDDESDDAGEPGGCDECCGAGGWRDCASSAAYCAGNPMPGREGVVRGGVEWFVVERGAAGRD